MALRQMPVYRSTSRPLLILGGEREPVLFLVLICGAIVFATYTPLSIGIGLVSWFVGLGVLRMMATHDPQMVKVFLRFWIRYRGPFWHANPTPASRGWLPPGQKRRRW